MSKLRAAIIGLGPHGVRMVDAVMKSETVELSAVVDRNERALSAPALPSTTRRTAELAGALEARPDLVCIMTNGPSHAELARTALKAGVRHLIVAKPMACSVAECQAILDEAAHSHARVGVDHIRRYNPAYLFLKERAASGDWGALRAAWMQRPGIGLGCNGTHSFDALQFIVGHRPQRVTAWLDPVRGPNPRGESFVDPGGLVVIEFEGGARATVAQIEDGAGPTSVELDFTAARVRLDEKSGEIEIIERDLSVKPGPGKPASYKRATLPDGLNAKVDMHQGLGALLQDVVGTGEISADARHGLTSVRVLAAAHLSARRGAIPVLLDDAELNNLWMPVT